MHNYNIANQGKSGDSPDLQAKKQDKSHRKATSCEQRQDRTNGATSMA